MSIENLSSKQLEEVKHYKCDNCKKIVSEDKCIFNNEKHFCPDCAFVNGLITPRMFLQIIGLDQENIGVVVENNIIKFLLLE